MELGGYERHGGHEEYRSWGDMRDIGGRRGMELGEYERHGEHGEYRSWGGI